MKFSMGLFDFIKGNVFENNHVLYSVLLLPIFPVNHIVILDL